MDTINFIVWKAFGCIVFDVYKFKNDSLNSFWWKLFIQKNMRIFADSIRFAENRLAEHRLAVNISKMCCSCLSATGELLRCYRGTWWAYRATESSASAAKFCKIKLKLHAKSSEIQLSDFHFSSSNYSHSHAKYGSHCMALILWVSYPKYA